MPNPKVHPVKARQTQCFCTARLDGFFHAISDELCELLGWSRDELLSKALGELIHDRDRGPVLRSLLRQQRRLRSESFQARFAANRGDWRWLRWQTTYDRDAGLYLGLPCDATSQVEAEQLLRASHERLAFVLDATGDAVWDCDLIKGVVSHNRRWIEVLGFTDDHLTHPLSFFLDLIHPDDQPATRELIGKALQTGQPYSAEFRIRNAAGNYLWISDHGRIVAWTDAGIPSRMVGAWSDITERKRIVEELRLQTDALANMAEGICLVDQESVILYANHNFEQMFGFEHGELVGKNPSILNSPSGGDPDRVMRRIVESLQRSGYWSGEVLNRRRDGSDFWTSATITEFTHQSFGKVWLNVQKDISETKRLREERDVAHEQLERLTARIQEDIEELRQELSREIHDDIGAALTGLRIQINLLASKAGSIGAARKDDYVGLIREIDTAMERTRMLCTRLRPPILSHLGLIDTCEWYVKSWSEQSGIKTRIRVRGRREPLGEALSIDMFRILQELLTNVARHANADKVNVELKIDEGLLTLSVADNGQGFQGRSSGIGLIGIRERLRRHGGGLKIESTEAGSTIQVIARFD